MQGEEAGETMCSEQSNRLLDLNIALEHVGGDRELLAELSTMFLQDYPRLLAEAKKSILDGNGPQLQIAAHTLKGRLAFFGIHQAYRTALDLETAARMNDFARARILLEEFESEMESALPEFGFLSGGLNA